MIQRQKFIDHFQGGNVNCPVCAGELVRVGNYSVCPTHGAQRTQAELGVDGPRPPTRSVFISYARADALEFATKLAADLGQRGGHEVFLDLKDIAKGALFECRLEDGIVRADVLAAVMSPSSLREQSICRDEVVFALNEAKVIVPLRIDDDPNLKPSLLLARRNWIDFTVDYVGGLDALLLYLSGDDSALKRPRLPSVTGCVPLNFSVEIARHSTGFTGRRWLLQELDEWLASDGPQALVIVAEPGVGKSAIAAWLSGERPDAVLAAHFCTQRNTRSKDPHEFTANLVALLHARLPGFAEIVEGCDPERRRDTASDTFRELIVEPARKITPPAKTALIVVDSLDEASIQAGESVLDVLVRQAPDLPPWLRILATTRPEEQVLRRIRGLDLAELRADREENIEDLWNYVDERLKAPGLDEQFGAVAEQVSRRIKALAEGNFLYAKLVLDAMDRSDLGFDDLGRLAPGLGGFFSDAFCRRFADVDEYALREQPILRALSVSRAELSFELLARLIGEPPEVLNRRILTLRPFLRVEKSAASVTYALFHKSLGDWLTDQEQAGAYWCEAEKGEKLLADLGWTIYQEGEIASHDYFLRHLPDHLATSGCYGRLRSVLTDPAIFHIACEQGRRHEWMRHWQAFPDQKSPGPEYRHVLEDSEEFVEHPHRRADLADEVGALLTDMGWFRDAVPFLSLAVEWREEMLGVRHPDLAKSLRHLAEAHRQLEEFDTAWPSYERALEIECACWGEESLEVARCYHDHANFHRDSGDLSEAILVNQRALRILEGLTPPNPAMLADCVNDTGVMLKQSGNHEEALSYYCRALELFREAYGEEHFDIATVLYNIGSYYEGVGNAERALHYMRRGCWMMRRFRVFDHPLVLDSWRRFRGCCLSKGEALEAIEIQREMIQATERLHGPVDRQTVDERLNLARILQALGRCEECEAELGALTTTLAGSPVDEVQRFERQVGEIYGGLAFSLANARNRSDEAERYYRLSLSACPDDVNTLGNLAQLLSTVGSRHEEAEMLFRKAFSLDPENGTLHLNYAGFQQNDLGDYAAAERNYRRALELFEASAGPDHAHVATSLNNLADLLRNTNRLSEAEPLNRRALEIRETLHGPEHVEIALAMNNLAVTLRRLGRLEEAERLSRGALEMDEKLRGADHPKIPHRLNNLCMVLLMRQRLTEASHHNSRAWRLKLDNPDVTSGRVLTMRITLAMLSGEAPGLYLGQLKTFLTCEETNPAGGVSVNWNADEVIDCLREHLPAGKVELLAACIDALGDRAALPALDGFPEWRDQTPIPMEEPWPELSL